MDLISPCGSMALPIGITGEDFPRRPFPTMSIGSIIATYLTERPSEFKECGPQCAAPKEFRPTRQSLLPRNFYYCVCNGFGFCLWSRDLGRFRTLSCTCGRRCFDKPLAKWRADAFTVLRVLTLRRPINYGPAHLSFDTLPCLQDFEQRCHPFGLENISLLLGRTSG